MASNTADEAFEGRSSTFIDWLNRRGATISPKIRLTDLRSQHAGRGVLAGADLAEDELLFSIPQSGILTVGSSSLPSDARQDLNDPWLSLILAMIHESQLGAASPWKPYFDVLPDRFDTLMYWSPDELRALEGSAVVDKIGRASADAAFTTQLIPLIRRYPDAFRASTLLTDAELLSLCHRMGSTIMAYAFDLSPEAPSEDNTAEDPHNDGWEEDGSEAGGGSAQQPKGMVPLADMLNADGAARNNARLFHEPDGAVAMRAIVLIPAGAQIFNDYGPLPRADVLRRYGYVASSYAPHDVVELSLQLVRETAAAMQRELGVRAEELGPRLALLEDHGVLEDGYDVARPDSEEGLFSDELKALLNCLTLPSPEFERLQKKDRVPKPELSATALRLLYAVLVRRRAMYPALGGDEMDTSDDGDGQTARRVQMARQVIAGEIEILEDAAKFVVDSTADGKKRKLNDFDQDVAEARSASKRSKEQHND